MAPLCLWREVQIPLENKHLPVSLALWVCALPFKLQLSDTPSRAQAQTPVLTRFLCGFLGPPPLTQTQPKHHRLSEAFPHLLALCSLSRRLSFSESNARHLDRKLLACMFDCLTGRLFRESLLLTIPCRALSVWACRGSVRDCGIELDRDNRPSSWEPLPETLGEGVPSPHQCEPVLLCPPPPVPHSLVEKLANG